MEIPQNILNNFFVREDYVQWINNETTIIAYLDLTNMFHWQDTLGWKFRIEDVIKQLLSYNNIKEVKVYYGLNERDIKNSEAFHNRIKKAGAILRRKPMKFIPKTIKESMFFQRKTLTLFDGTVINKIKDLINELQKSGISIIEPKCNFDVEIAMDMIDDTNKISAIMLFSGDCDLLEPLKRLKIENKKIGIVGVRGKVATELHQIKDKYFNFGQFYNGKRTYLTSENPA